jgi:hypothetical protein
MTPMSCFGSSLHFQITIRRVERCSGRHRPRCWRFVAHSENGHLSSFRSAISPVKSRSHLLDENALFAQPILLGHRIDHAEDRCVRTDSGGLRSPRSRNLGVNEFPRNRTWGLRVRFSERKPESFTAGPAEFPQRAIYSFLIYLSPPQLEFIIEAWRPTVSKSLNPTSGRKPHAPHAYRAKLVSRPGTCANGSSGSATDRAVSPRAIS